MALATLACLEKLCSIMNLVAVERDWVSLTAQRSYHSLSSSARQVIVVAGDSNPALRGIASCSHHVFSQHLTQGDKHQP